RRTRIAGPPYHRNAHWGVPRAGSCGTPAHLAGTQAGPHRDQRLRLRRRASATCEPVRAGPAPYWPPPFPLRARVRDPSIHRGVATVQAWCRPCAADTETESGPYLLLHVLDFVGHRKESGMPINLALRRIEQRLLVGRAAGHDIGGLHHPDAQAFVTTGIDVASIVQGHLGVRRVQAAYMLVSQPVLAAYEDLPERPGGTAHDLASL